MAWTAPQFSKSEVDKAGAALVTNNVFGTDFQIVDNWRSSHNYPLNFFQNDLRKRAKAIDCDCIVAQRIKRLSSITEKLKRFSTARLSQIQDIGGCRAVMYDIGQVQQLADNYRNSGFKSDLHNEKDYIKAPKPDGYRGIHLVYKYAAQKPEYHGLKIEIQLRSAKQHAWATAVETVGLFTRQALKSNRGYWEWRRFFASMGTAIAYMENSSAVPNTATYGNGLQLLLKDYMISLDVANQLRTYEKALLELPSYQKRGDHYFLLILDPLSKQLEVFGYKQSQLQLASKDYLAMEKSIRGSDKNAVLVSADSTVELRKAYPNYFLDTTAFLDLIDDALS